MQHPDDLKYSKEHEWVRVEGDVAVVGITDFAQDQLGDVVFVSLPDVGAIYRQFEKFGEVESVKSVSDLFIPVGGEIIERNEQLFDQPELVNSQPYGAGWMLRVRMSDPNELNNLMSAADYRAQVGAEG